MRAMRRTLTALVHRVRPRRGVLLSVLAVVAAMPVGVAAPEVHAADWNPIGGPYASDPTPVTSSEGRFVFITDDEGHPYHHQHVGLDLWNDPIPLGGRLTSVVAVTERGTGSPGPVELFGVGTDDALWFRRLTTGWESLGGVIVSAPVAYRFGQSTFVFGVGGDEALWYRQLTNGVFSPWQSLGGRILSDPAVMTDGTDLYVSGLGGDDALWVRRLSGASWGPWESLGGRLVSFPDAQWFPGGGWVVGVGVDGAVWYQRVVDGRWLGWQSFGGVAASGAILLENPWLVVAVVGVDGAMWLRQLLNGTWTPWKSEGGVIASNPSGDGYLLYGLDPDGMLMGARYQ